MSIAKLRQRAGEKGSILVMTAVCLTALMGITALAIDASFLFDMRHRMEAAADAGALAAALENRRNTTATCCGSGTNLWTFAKHDIELQNFNVTTDFSGLNGSFAVRRCSDGGATCDPSHSGAVGAKYVEVVLEKNVPTFFMRLFGRTAMKVSARAVAGIGVSPYCLISLATTKTEKGVVTDIEKAVELQGGKTNGATVEAPGCWVQVNSNATLTKKSGKGTKGSADALVVNSDAVLTASKILVAGGVTNNGTINGTVTEDAPPLTDPLLNLPEPPTSPCMPGTDQIAKKGGPALTLSPGCYGDIEVEEGGVLTLTGPGNFVLNGKFKTSDKGGTINATNVMIYSAADKKGNMNEMKIQANNVVNMTAQTSGSYAGILLFGTRSGTKAKVQFDDSAEYNLSGTIYYPNADIEFGNKKSKKTDPSFMTTDCMVFIGRKIKFKKNADLMNSCAAYDANTVLKTVTVAENP